MSTTSNILNGAVTIGLGAYIIDVAYNGNTKNLGELLKEETGYIDFIVALFILGAIQNYGPANKINSLLITITVIGLFLKVGGQSNIMSAISDFSSGNASIVDTIKKLGGA